MSGFGQRHTFRVGDLTRHHRQDNEESLYPVYGIWAMLPSQRSRSPQKKPNLKNPNPKTDGRPCLMNMEASHLIRYLLYPVYGLERDIPFALAISPGIIAKMRGFHSSPMRSAVCVRVWGLGFRDKDSIGPPKESWSHQTRPNRQRQS